MPLGRRGPDCLLPHERGEDCGQAEVLVLMTSQTIFIISTHFSEHLFTDRAMVVGRPSSELPTFSLDWLCWQCQQFSIKKVVFEEVRRQYLIFEAEYASFLALRVRIYL